MAQPTSYYAHGKLLLTGEYAVLDGAVALAVPSKLGQRLDIV
ncbi:MAG: GHMP kinase, partial [Bacteroidota bacterium]